MIPKVENKLNLSLETLTKITEGLQKEFDQRKNNLPEWLNLNEDGVTLVFETAEGDISYSLAQCKTLIELYDIGRLIVGLGEIA